MAIGNGQNNTEPGVHMNSMINIINNNETINNEYDKNYYNYKNDIDNGIIWNESNAVLYIWIWSISALLWVV